MSQGNLHPGNGAKFCHNNHKKFHWRPSGNQDQHEILAENRLAKQKLTRK